jgi:hypothetical protein
MEKMKKNLLLVSFVAVAALMILGFASAELATSVGTEFNSVSLGASTTMVGNVGDTVPVRVTFQALSNESDVKVKVSMEGFRDDVSDSTDRFDIEDGVVYTKLLNLQLPSDSDQLSEKYTLYVEIVSKDDRTEKQYTISVQRESYTLEILTADYSSRVSAGDIVPVSVVVRNNGYDRLNDVYVRVSIPALGISSQGYVGDLISTDECVLSKYDNEIVVNNCDDEDSMEKTVSLKIPEDAKSGVYEIQIEAYDRDADVVATKLISVSESESTMVLAAAKNKDLNAGQTVTYDLVIVNSANDIKVFNINAVSGDSLKVSVPSVITVGPESSESVPITVTAADDAEVGTYTFSVGVNGEQTVFGANVIKGGNVSTSVVALTVVLVIIFIVLLAVLIVLLTRKEKPIEEVETSYY